MSKPTRDRFDDVPRASGRVGAHRAETPRINGWVALLWSIVAALVLIIGGIFGALIVMDRISLFPDAEVTPQPTSTIGIVDTSYSVMILNATPEEGLDAQFRDLLINNGWVPETVYASQSASSDFPNTTVYYIDDADHSAALGLAGLIGGALVEKSDFYAALNDTGEKQLTIVIGLDDQTAAPETPAEDAPTEEPPAE